MSWLLLYLLPTAFYAAVDVVPYTLVLLATFSLYELGYIFNDTVAVRRETQPSLRLSEKETRYFFAHRRHIIGTRVLTAAVCLCTLYALYETPYTLLYALALMVVLFAIYNQWRNRYNVFLYIWLVCSRYLPFMCLSEHSLREYILLFVSYPLLIGIERFSMPSYRWPLIRRLIPTESSKALFRAAYYVTVLLILVPYCYYTDIPLYELTPIGILALYRIVRLFIKEK